MSVNPALSLQLVAMLTVTLDPVVDLGLTVGGHRRVIPITGGSVDGPVLYGEVLPGGADWNLERPDGSSWVHARYALQTRDGVMLGITNEGHPAPPGGRNVIMTVARLEAPFGPYEWLNSTPLIGTLAATPGRDGEAVSIELWRPTPTDN